MTRPTSHSHKPQQSSRSDSPEMHVHGPQNAEHELRKAYNTLIEAQLTYEWDHRPNAGVNFHELPDLYRRGYDSFRKGDRLAAERWARATKHLARALWSEAKVAFLQPRLNFHPFLEGATPDEYNLHERIDTTADLLDSLADDIPPGLQQMPEDMTRFLSKGRRHIEEAQKPELKNELLRAEHIKAAHEYGRVIECMALGHEAESQGRKAA